MKILVLITHEKIFNLIAKSLDFIFRKIGINYFFFQLNQELQQKS